MRTELTTLPAPGPMTVASPIEGYVFRSSGKSEYQRLRDNASRLMDRDEHAYTVIYLPMAVAEVVWEFADTVRDGLLIQRDPSLKAVSRELKSLPSDYRHHFSRIGITPDKLGKFTQWKETFMEQIHDGREVTKQMLRSMDECGVRPSQERKGLVAAAYVTLCFAEALRRYCRVHERRFAILAGLPDYGDILPESFFRVIPLMERVIGSDRLPEEVTGQVVHQMQDLFDQLAEEAGESPERYAYRTACVAYRNNCGCRAQARRGTFGCYPTSKCKRMLKYDTTHDK